MTDLHLFLERLVVMVMMMVVVFVMNAWTGGVRPGYSAVNAYFNECLMAGSIGGCKARQKWCKYVCMDLK